MAGEETGLKQLLQGLAPDTIGLCEGVVVSSAPLSIQVTNNPQMVASGITLALPRHLTNYVTTCAVATVSGGDLIGKTKSEQAHTHDLDSMQWAKATITMYNSLAVGEKVWMLRFGKGEKYYVLDRKG